MIRKVFRRSRALASAARGDRKARYLIAEALDRVINPGHYFGEDGQVWFPAAKAGIPTERFGEWNLYRRWDRLWNLRQFAGLVNPLEGDSIEFGSFSGASSYVILDTLEAGRHWCVDSFQGLSAPNPRLDGSSWSYGDLAVSDAVLRRNLTEFEPRLEILKGWIPEVLRGIDSSATFRFAHIDVDLYEPTRDALEFLKSRVVPGAVVVCDDYGSSGCPGARIAVDEFAHSNPGWSLLHLSSTQAVLLASWG